jgi:hypothetical protein
VGFGWGAPIDLTGGRFILALPSGAIMDEIRAEFWEAIRHLFPDNAVAIALEQGDLLFIVLG